MTGAIPIVNPERHEQGGKLYPGQPLMVYASSVWLACQPSPITSVDRMADVEMVNPRHWEADAARRWVRRALKRERDDNRRANEDAVQMFLNKR